MTTIHQIDSKRLSELLLNQSNKHVCEMMLKRIEKKYKSLQEMWKKYAIDSKHRYIRLSKEHGMVQNDLKEKERTLTKTVRALNLAEAKEMKLMKKIENYNFQNKLRERRSRKTRAAR